MKLVKIPLLIHSTREITFLFDATFHFQFQKQLKDANICESLCMLYSCFENKQCLVPEVLRAGYVGIQGLKSTLQNEFTAATQTKGRNSETAFCLPASCCLCQMSILKTIQIKLKICNYIFPFNCNLCKCYIPAVQIIFASDYNIHIKSSM